MKYFVIYAFLASIFLAFVGDLKNRFRWTAWTGIVLLGVLIFILELNCQKKNKPITKDNLLSVLTSFQASQDSVRNNTSTENFEQLKLIENSNERVLRTFIESNRGELTNLNGIQIPLSFYLVGDSAIAYISNNQIEKQVNILNEEFQPEGIQFVKEEIRKVESNYFKNISLDLKGFTELGKFSLLIDNNPNLLNIVLGDFPGLGVTTMPFINTSYKESKMKFGRTLSY